ncbi:MAG: phosphotransferase family protein, partial [Acidothermales bacterium]|nr:phosphotransferase family protein [Acidothermales bacterium]
LATAHDMRREYTVMAALAKTDVPVPAMVLLHEDADVLGAPFYLMADVPGTVYRSERQTARLGAERARLLSYALVDVLAALHAVAPDAVGLTDFGRPDGYLTRQLKRWRTQLDASRSRDLPALDELHARLSAGIPVTHRHTVVHGDYRLDNTIVSDDDRIVAVVDWEMATLGDPLADLGLLAVYWDALTEIPETPLRGGVTREAGFPPASELAERYAARTGTDLTDLPWYIAFGHFKLAVIAEGIHYRNLQGKTVGPGFDTIGEAVVPLSQRGLTILEGR